MAAMLDPRKVKKLRGVAFIEAVQANPLLIHTPALAFFKTYLESVGGECTGGTHTSLHSAPYQQV